MALYAATLFSTALGQVNTQFAQQNKPYEVVLAKEDSKIEPKEPIFLALLHKDRTKEPIGITHVVRLEGANWDNIGWEELARSVEQIKSSIFQAVEIYLKAKEDPAFLINENGVVFQTNGLDIQIDKKGYFIIDKNPLTFNGRQILARQISGEGICQFSKLENGHYQFKDGADLREGKGMFIDPSGVLYRK